MSLLLVYVTHSDERAAQRMCSILIEEQLIACANLFPITSMYRWDSQMTRDSEIVSLLKTDQQRADELETRIKQLHDYDKPCIIRMQVSANTEYENWVEDQCRGGAV